MIRKWAQDIFYLFYPNNCGLCSSALVQGEEQLCTNCLLSLPQTNFHQIPNNPLEQLLGGRFIFERATAFYYFDKEGKMQNVLHSIKYQGHQFLANHLGKIMGHSCQAFFDDVDIIVPIPLAKQKENHRGFNQSICIGEGLQAYWNIPMLPNLVQRIKNTETQTKKSRMERIENMRDAFKWNPAKLNKYQHILLIDDVITTGATIESCVQAIPDNIDIKISILSLAAAIES